MTDKTYVREIFEIFEEINAEETFIDRVKKAEEYKGSVALATIVDLAFNEHEYIFDKNKLPKWTPAPEQAYPSSLNNINLLQTLVKFVWNPSITVPHPETIRRMWVNILESVHPRDADLLVAVVQGNLKDLYPKVSRAVMIKVFPNVIKETEEA